MQPNLSDAVLICLKRKNKVCTFEAVSLLLPFTATKEKWTWLSVCIFLHNFWSLTSYYKYNQTRKLRVFNQTKTKRGLEIFLTDILIRRWAATCQALPASLCTWLYSQPNAELLKIIDSTFLFAYMLWSNISKDILVNLCGFIYITYTDPSIHIYIHIHTNTHTDTHIRIWIYTCMHACIYTRIHVYTNTCIIYKNIACIH